MRSTLNWNLSKSAFWLLLLSLPFGYRVLLYQFTPGFEEYESVFLYASDLFLLLFLGLSVKTLVPKNHFPAMFIWFFLGLAGLSIFFASYKLLAGYNFVRLVFLMAMAMSVAKVLVKRITKFEAILGVIGALALVESVIGFLQFVNQKSLGLWFLGESALGPFVSGVAKITISGGMLSRAYGTFPHPNVLAAFLLLGLFGIYFFWLRRKAENLINEILIGISLFVVAMGLVLTFSRAAWLIGILLTFALMIYLLFQKSYRLQAIRLIVLLLATFYLLLTIFSWAIFPRAGISPGEPAVSQRLAYNELGFGLIKNRPEGVGLGNQVIYAVKNGLYQNLGLNQVWQWQPIHNLYLLIAAEIGILGLIGFLVFLGVLVVKASGYFDLESQIILTMFSALLLFGFFDHFLWTLQPGRLMFWLVVGLMMGLTIDRLRPHSSVDRAQASGA